MSTRMAAEIWIGGQVPKGLVRKLMTQVAAAGVALEWGDAYFEPETASDLERALQEVDGVSVLWLCHEEARYGQFPDLEEFLQKRGLPYDRASEGIYEFDAELVQYRPGMAHSRVFITNKACQPVLERTAVRQALSLLKKRRTQAALLALDNLVGADVPPLSPFEILR